MGTPSGASEVHAGPVHHRITAPEADDAAAATGVPTHQPERRAGRRGPSPTAARVAREAAILLVVYVLYGQVRNLVEGRVSTAEAFASWLLSVERSWGIDIELGMNQWVAAREPVAVTMNYYYAVLHMLVPITVLVWLWRRHPTAYPLARTALVVGSLIALLGYWLLPLAPPRLLPELGYIDTFWHYDTWGSLSDPTLARFSNQYAAMPSLHVGWALWAGVTLAVVSRRWWGLTIGLVYPTTTILVVVGTANHFILDAAGSLVVMAAGTALAVVWRGPPSIRPHPRVAVLATALVGTTLALLIVMLRPPYDAPQAAAGVRASGGHAPGAVSASAGWVRPRALPA